MNVIRAMGLALVLAACGGRALPEVDAAAGASTNEYDVTRALREDPPLPGASASGWEGLQEAAPAADPHAHHHHHRAEPAPSGSAPPAPSADPHAHHHHQHGAEPAPSGSSPKGGSHAH